MKTNRKVLFSTNGSKKIVLLIFLWISALPLVQSQFFGFQIPPGKEKVEIPFSFNNGFIVIGMIFNGTFPMQFIFDTGAEYTILTRKEYAELLGLSYSKEYKIIGSDMKTELTAYLTRGVSFKNFNLIAENQDIFVLEDDYFRFEEYVGENIHGIIGASFFRNLILEIDYQKQRLIFYSQKGFSEKDIKGFTKHPISISKGKPYLTSSLTIQAKEKIASKLLIDTGASLGLLIHTDSTSALKIPERVIPGKVGNGLGGELMGYLGRVERLKIKDYHFDNIITSFQEIDSKLDTSFLNGRNGIIGNILLERFTVIIDYIKRDLYLKPNKSYRKDFKFDKSGIRVIATGPNLTNFTVHNVLASSNAAHAGVQKGDRIISLNRVRASFLNLKNINRQFQKRAGKKIRLKVLRGGDKKVIRFKLKNLI